TSGSGKTTVTAGLVRALRRRGLTVQPFKAGPDYIDPSYHARAAGRPCRNLDTWLVPADALRELYQRANSGGTVALIEGVMGLFDGRGGGEEGSTAHLAKLLGRPVVVVIDVGRTSRSAGAIALGCQRFDPALDVVGFILNRVASDNHRRWASEAVTTATGLPVLGWLPRRDDLGLPERHLGLIPTTEGRIDEAFFERLADQVEQSFDLDRLLALARSQDMPSHNSKELRMALRLPRQIKSAGRSSPDLLPEGAEFSIERADGQGFPNATAASLFPSQSRPVIVAIGLAVDEAFSFYYEDNLDLLRAWGAQLVPFSPLHDAALPEGIAALYIGGGFPELYARDLAANHAMITAIRSVARRGMPIYAECGGLMYLSEGITDFDGQCFPMVGLVPAWSAMVGRRLTLGYRELRARVDTPLLHRGETARGHEFHWSVLKEPPPSNTAAYDAFTAPGSGEGYARGNLLASYCHLHFASNPVLAPNFVATALRWQRTGP
ncbi:MAG TPA: cobyrinate a,c-diamide synthase, partial [Chloroflexota bacterium]|nr:cobyrinate a,c-diamide synthase [Chloroflexota bacterium]